MARSAARMAVGVFSSSMDESSSVLIGVRLCGLEASLPPLLHSFNALTDLVIELHYLSKRCGSTIYDDR